MTIAFHSDNASRVRYWSLSELSQVIDSSQALIHDRWRTHEYRPWTSGFITASMLLPLEAGGKT